MRNRHYRHGLAYITDVKGIRGKLNTAPAKKKGKFKAWVEKMQEKAGAKPLK